LLSYLVKLNFGQSPDFSIQLKVLLSERISQKLKWPTVNLISRNWSAFDMAAFNEELQTGQNRQWHGVMM